MSFEIRVLTRYLPSSCMTSILTSDILHLYLHYSQRPDCNNLFLAEGWGDYRIGFIQRWVMRVSEGWEPPAA